MAEEYLELYKVAHVFYRSPPNQTMIEPLPGHTLTEETAMRVFALAAVLLLSSSLVPAFAEEAAKAAGSNQPQTVPVQPERTPQQSEQSREQDRERAEETRIGPGWKAQQRDDDRMQRRDDDRVGRMDQNNMGRMMDRDSESRTVGRDWRARPDDRADRDGYGRGSYDEDRPRLRRVKVCFEYENGDEYCRYRR